MEKITKEIFKSGDKLFLNEKECLIYEKKVYNTKLIQEIVTFLLIEEGFVEVLSDRVKRLQKKDSYITTYEFLFISGYIILNKYINKTNPEETIKLHLCEIETFKKFYSEMLKIEE